MFLFTKINYSLAQYVGNKIREAAKNKLDARGKYFGNTQVRKNKIEEETALGKKASSGL